MVLAPRTRPPRAADGEMTFIITAGSKPARFSVKTVGEPAVRRLTYAPRTRRFDTKRIIDTRTACAVLSPRIRKRLFHHTRQCVAMATLAAVVACSLGVSLPIRHSNSPPSDSETPFPCMNCPCGCKTAEHCWRNCCCHTQEEKLAWARRNGVTPPAFVLAAVGKSDAGPSCCKCAQRRSCCEQPAAATSARYEDGARSCCSRRGEHGAQRVAKKSGPAVLLIEALGCRGLTPLLTALPPSIVPPSVDRSLHNLPTGTDVVVNDRPLCSLKSPPSTPPPECCA